MSDLFDTQPEALPDTAPRPLADRLRPRKLSDVIGQQQVLGPEGEAIRRPATASRVPSPAALATPSMTPAVFTDHPLDTAQST